MDRIRTNGPTLSQILRWCPSWTISRHLFEYKVIFGPRRKHIWCVQRKHSDTIRHTLTVTSPIIPCLQRNFSILITNLSILLEVWNHTQTLLLQAKIEAPWWIKISTLDKIWGASLWIINSLGSESSTRWVSPQQADKWILKYKSQYRSREQDKNNRLASCSLW